MTTARVFPTKTRSRSPDDELAFFGPPDLFVRELEIDRVNVSCSFSWDVEKAEKLAKEWRLVCKNVHVGGPAFDDRGGEFTPGMYVRKGSVITSRGCPKNCQHCFVPKREGKLRELKIHEGHDVLDNNLLACSDEHVRSVFDMLEGQNKITLTGGLDIFYLKDWHIDRLLRLGRRLSYFYIAYDSDSVKQRVADSIKRFHEAGIKQAKIGVYVLVGFDGDTPAAADERCEFTFVNGGLPFAMYYRPPDDTRKAKPAEWAAVCKKWTWVPNVYKHMKKNGPQYHNKIIRGDLVKQV